MTSYIARKAGLSLFERHLENYAPQDPLYETYVDSKGKTKRRKRELPPGLSARDAKILQSVKKRAHHLDKGFYVCGIRFGWTFIIGIIPIVGDVANAGLNHIFVIKKAKKAEIPRWLLRRMILNNIVSTGIGLVPFVGDVAMAAFKANSRNAALLEEFLRIRGEEYLKATANRTENPVVIKPGAGRKRDEIIPEKKPGTDIPDGHAKDALAYSLLDSH
ncbi:hypothetical protein BU17DRAFT_74670 [Hysterangium stoloniferum]|nr:hypothetical protein BU17DRAFT_74670 [Hysterangium stoloniferum]